MGPGFRREDDPLIYSPAPEKERVRELAAPPYLSPLAAALSGENFPASQVVLRGLDPRIHVFVSTASRRECARI